MLFVIRLITDQIRAESVACRPVMKHDAISIFVRHIHGRADHFRVHVPHLQVYIVYSVEEIAKVSAAYLNAAGVNQCN